MFESLGERMQGVFKELRGEGHLTDYHLETALREIRLSLLEADVELGVIKRFLARVEERAIGQTVRTHVKHSGQKHQVSASDQFIKICHDELVAIMEPWGAAIRAAGGYLPGGPHTMAAGAAR